MMTGIVNADLEPTLPLCLLDQAGQSREIEGVVDTGFNGFLTLPTALIANLGLPWLCQEQGVLADGTIQVFDVYVATLQWEGQQRRVETQASASTPLIGMSLILGHRLGVDVREGGEVTVDSPS